MNVHNQIYYIYMVHVLFLNICGMYNIILSCQILSLGSNLLLSIVTAKTVFLGGNFFLHKMETVQDQQDENVQQK